MEVASTEDFAAALARAHELAENEGSQAARDFLAGCTGEAALLVHLRVEIYARQRDDRDSLLEAETAWRELGPESSGIGFQLACVLQSLIEATGAKGGPSSGDRAGGGAPEGGPATAHLAPVFTRFIAELPDQPAMLSGPRWLNSDRFDREAGSAVHRDDALGIALLAEGTLLFKLF
jgi:hypothetical protein